MARASRSSSLLNGTWSGFGTRLLDTGWHQSTNVNLVCHVNTCFVCGFYKHSMVTCLGGGNSKLDEGNIWTVNLTMLSQYLYLSIELACSSNIIQSLVIKIGLKFRCWHPWFWHNPAGQSDIWLCMWYYRRLLWKITSSKNSLRYIYMSMTWYKTILQYTLAHYWFKITLEQLPYLFKSGSLLWIFPKLYFMWNFSK